MKSIPYALAVDSTAYLFYIIINFNHLQFAEKPNYQYEKYTCVRIVRVVVFFGAGTNSKACIPQCFLGNNRQWPKNAQLFVWYYAC